MTEPTDDAPHWFVRCARMIGMDRAVGYAVLTKLWQVVTGPVTQLLIVFCFSDFVQAHYYALVWLLGMQIFVELGLHVVIINLSSHEWARLSWNQQRVTGDLASAARLGSLLRLFLRWYLAAAVLFVLVVGAAGWLYLSNTVRSLAQTNANLETVAWQAPWCALVLLTGLQLTLMPMTALLEGCDQLRTINRIRFWQAFAGTLLVWLLVVSGAGLWTLVGIAALRLAGESWLVFGEYGPFLRSLSVNQSTTKQFEVEWKREVLPLQWRLAVQGILLWCVNGVPGLVIFRWHNDEATRYGMTWTILTALQAASLAWIETRRPLFGALIAERRFGELDRLFFRVTRWSVSLLPLTGAAFLLVVWWLGTRNEWLFARVSGRLLSVEPTLYFVIAMSLYQFALCTNLYVRAHKRDPFLAASVVSSLTIASLQFMWGRSYGVTGVALGYLVGIGCVQVPLWTVIWWNARRLWH